MYIYHKLEKVNEKRYHKIKGMALPRTSSLAFCWYSKKESEEIKKACKIKVGFGSTPVVVTLGKTTWKNSIFPDKRSGTYLLPLKAEVRKKEDIVSEDIVSFMIQI